jgi:hypothetical protein
MRARIRAPVSIRERLLKEIVPSRLALFIRLADLDKEGHGILSLDEVADDNPIIEGIRSSAKDYLNNLSFLSALFAFSMLTIVAQTTPPSGFPAAPFTESQMSNSPQLLAAYIILASFGMVCELVTCLICVVWYTKICSQTPHAEDVVWFMLHHNMALPVGILILGVFSIVFAIACLIFVNYGLQIGAIVSAVAGLPLLIMALLLVWSMNNTTRGLKNKATLMCAEIQDQANILGRA